MSFQTKKEASLLHHLQDFFPESSTNTLKKWIKFGRVFIGTRKAERPNELVPSGETISLDKKQGPEKPAFEILYQDKHLIAINKPSGLVSVATNDANEVSAHKLLKIKFRPSPVYVVHRIDRDTSGVMLFALSTEARDRLRKMLEKKEPSRLYRAIVEGKPEEDEGRWSSYLYEDSNYLVHATPDPTKGKRAVTHYKVIRSSKHFSELEFKLETGRKNQIRVHCQEAGCPIVGDKKYGSTSNPVKRLCLHAKTLSFKHPITQKPLTFDVDMPQSFSRLVK